jgi:hypothetical protein
MAKISNQDRRSYFYSTNQTTHGSPRANAGVSLDNRPDWCRYCSRSAVKWRRNRRDVRARVGHAHRGRGPPRLRAVAAGELPSRATRRRGRRDAMAHRAHRYGSGRGPLGVVRPARHRRRCGRSPGESPAPAAGSLPGYRCSPVVPRAGWCHSRWPSVRHKFGG